VRRGGVVDPDAALARGHAQVAVVVQALQRAGRRLRQPTPGVDGALAAEAIGQRARMDRPLLAGEREQCGGKPGRHEAPVGAVGIEARVEQPRDPPRHEAVGIEEVLFQLEPRKGALQVACRIVCDAVPQDQILRACGEADRVGLDETEGADGAGEGGWRGQGGGEDLAAQVLEGQGCRSSPRADGGTHRGLTADIEGARSPKGTGAARVSTRAIEIHLKRE